MTADAFVEAVDECQGVAALCLRCRRQPPSARTPRRHEPPRILTIDEALGLARAGRRGGTTVGGTDLRTRTIPLPVLVDDLDVVDRGRPTIFCLVGGFRSSVAASTQRGRGFTQVADMVGGFGAWSTPPSATRV